MDTKKHIIINNGIDITADVKRYQYNPETGRYDVTFNNGKTYPYGYHSIECIKNPEVLNPSLVHILHDKRELFNIIDVRVFHAKTTDYWHICFSDGSDRTYDQRDIKVVTSCLQDEEVQNVMRYLQQQASINELRSKDGEILLQKQYEKIKFVGDDTAMAIYLNPKVHKIHTYHREHIIFPFGGNASQFKAIKNALTNQISVVQGPPGTGKTQTILNIIANLLVDNKAVQIVSNNNSATMNVLDKMSHPNFNMGFLVAQLGNSDNKKAFIQDQKDFYPDFSGWHNSADKQKDILAKIKSYEEELSDAFIKQERLAKARLELDSLLLEIKYFQQYCNETSFDYSDIKPRRTLETKRLMQLWQECYEFTEKERVVSFWFKIKSVFIYGISNWKFFNSGMPIIISLLQNLFYQARESELNSEITELEKFLKSIDADRKMKELVEMSKVYLRAKLFERYGDKTHREILTEDDLWKQPTKVVKEYPVILSTTFSSRSCLKDLQFDYLIMDEASQVDLATGALALSCASNTVIVGDLKQLPNVVTDDMKKRCDAVFNSYKLPNGYSFSENSFLKSVCNIIPNTPQTMLREHYRCHPKIIGFCNQKFYNNELVIMTEDNGKSDTLAVFKTAVGNHRRDHINQRQVDVTIQEVLPTLKDTNPDDIGIVVPYRDQINTIFKQMGSDKIDVNTIHKFQGREKDTIILNTVDDIVTDFSDNPYLLNVAVSRAKRRFILVVSGSKQPNDSNIADLISYIDYNNFQIVQSEIYSVFDLLYREYTDARIRFLNKHPHISEYDSENLMYGEIVDMLDNRPQLSLKVICHQPLNMLIRDPKHLNDEECRYAMNKATHIDFLIYNIISKKPILAIEVDGFHNHKPGTQQYERDRMKDHILELYGIPLIRLSTNGSSEIKRICQALDEYEKGR
jgi:superfamily I DNA and/or RNA helicase